VDEETPAQVEPIPPELLRQSFETALEVIEALIHEIGDPPDIVRKFNALLTAIAGQA
jgi:hypothetical protein